MSGTPLKERPDWPLGPVDYNSLETPVGYRCYDCDAHGVRLWREYNTFLDHQHLRCYDCVLQHRGLVDGQNEYSWAKPVSPANSEIGGLIAAVVTAEGDTFWGYSSVPVGGCAWWWALSPRRDERWDDVQRYKALLAQWKDGCDVYERLWKSDKELMSCWVRRTESLEGRLREIGVDPGNWRPYDEMKK